MGQRLEPIYSEREDEFELREELDAFVLRLAEWIDDLQDAWGSANFAAIGELGENVSQQARELGYAALCDVIHTLTSAAADSDSESTRKSIEEITEVVQRVRRGHRGAA